MLLGILLLPGAIAACGVRTSPPTPGPESRGFAQFNVSSNDFGPGGTIPRVLTCDGEGRSPHLEWSGAPVGTRAFVVIVDDSDTPGQIFAHWLVYDLPTGTRSLRAGIGPGDALPGAARQGQNSAGGNGYIGPCPPQGATHEYRFFVYALDTVLEIEAGATFDELIPRLQGHVLGVGQVSAMYARP